MAKSYFLLPFRETRNESKFLSPLALLIVTLMTIILMMVTEIFIEDYLILILSIIILYIISFLVLIFLRASFLRTVKFVLAASILIFFIGIPSFFLQIGDVMYSVKIGNHILNLYLDGIMKAVLIWLRGILSVSLITLYSTTVTMQEFIQGLRGLFIPNIMVTIILLILRYAPLFFQQGTEISIAQKLRGLEYAPRKRKIAAAGALMGGTLIRSISRGNEVYEAMVMRGMEESFLVRREEIKILDPIILLVITVVLSLVSGGILKCIMK